MKQIVLGAWGLWDWMYFRCNRMAYISKEDNVFRVIKKTYTGPPLMTQSGDWIRTGDIVLKIHLYNYGLAKHMLGFSSDVSRAYYVRKNIEQSLKGLSQYIAHLPDKHQIKGIIGTSVLNRTSDKLGFVVHEVEPHWSYKMKGYLFKLIYLLMHPQGLQYLKVHGSKLEPKHLVMSVQELLQWYPNEPENDKVGIQHEHHHFNRKQSG